ncbi:DMT family transporter [Paenibacillus sp. SC116]|uniref:DMT family transporter n=1 Tax=Paenibacillus sp. SC116 TaxID=2968986 RepID=UPI00215AB990|nr:DMT family transporter [Paenibacillus sp. SC116]MCR8842817.1 DMT family transporter [Paenibacillus sp. SC116]
MKGFIYTLLIFTSMLWGGNFVASKLLVDHAEPLTLVLFRWGIAVIVWLPIVLKKEKNILPPRAAWLPLLLMGLTGVLLFNVCMFYALEHTTATNTGLISALNPIMIALLSFIFYRDRLHTLQIVAMCVSFSGVIYFILQGDLSRLWLMSFNIGDLWMLGSVLIWGIYSIASKWAMMYISPFLSTFWGGIIGVFLMLPLEWRNMISTTGDIWFWIGIAYTSVGATVAAMMFWNIGVQRVGGTQAGMFLNLNPIFTGVFAYLILNEQMTMQQWIGAMIVLCGVFAFTVIGIKTTREEQRRHEQNHAEQSSCVH